MASDAELIGALADEGGHLPEVLRLLDELLTATVEVHDLVALRDEADDGREQHGHQHGDQGVDAQPHVANVVRALEADRRRD